MYGRSESEQTLIGGEAGRESHNAPVSMADDDSPLTAIVLPRCSRAAVADSGRGVCEPNAERDEAGRPDCDGGPLRLWWAPALAALPACCDCSEPICGGGGN